MDDNMQGIDAEFWCGLAVVLICGVVTFILFRRRHWWLRFLNAEESFWERFGIPKSKGGLRAFAEGRFFRTTFALITVVLFVMAAVDVVLYLKAKR
jgi:hypothetical protein